MQPKRYFQPQHIARIRNVRNDEYVKYKFDRGIAAEVKSLCELDNWHAPLALLSDYVIVVAAVLMVKAGGWAFYPLAVLVIGSRQRALTTIVHEAAHSTLTRNKTLARLLATVCSGYLILQTFNAYKTSHVTAHHGHFGDRSLDPDYRYMLSKGVYDIRDERTLIWQLLIKPCLLCNVPSYLGYLLRDRMFGSGRAEHMENLWLGLYWLSVIGCAVALGQGWNLLLFWVVPYLTAFQVIGWFIELAEHAPLMRNESELYRTRNRNSHWLERLLTGMHGESYHLAHHLRPRVPFWRIAELHQLLLRDPLYRAWDRECGGIFLSSNAAPSVIALLMRECRSLRA